MIYNLRGFFMSGFLVSAECEMIRNGNIMLPPIFEAEGGDIRARLVLSLN